MIIEKPFSLLVLGLEKEDILVRGELFSLNR
jgi:hypothetical protein